MYETMVLFALFGTILWLVWYFAQPRPLFVIRISDGNPRVIQGKVTDTFLKGVAEICRLSDTSTGTIKAFREKSNTRLHCSADMSAGCQQQLRNMLHAGW